MAVASKRASSKMPKKAKVWSRQETLFLIKVWGARPIFSALKNSRRNAACYDTIAQRLARKGYSRDPEQCRAKINELRCDYFTTKFNTTLAGWPLRCPFYDELHVIHEKNEISNRRQSVRCTQNTPGRHVENSPAQQGKEKNVENNQPANSSFGDGTDPGQGSSVGPAGSLRPMSPAPAALQPSQIQKRKRASKDGLKESMERSNMFLERLVEFLERIEKQQKRNFLCSGQNNSPSSPGSKASTPRDPRTWGKNSRALSHETFRSSQGKCPSSHF
ncbi:uncharacterized protein LOC142823168 [Pelodiscus sinensis]|uniref:uncharacterized protein LOC142823168 n=1 Tax=Pelodiscus sinensis TaxID=13735 RepID=UPI003F6D7881